MKVLLVNGSSHKNGCTYTALNEIARILVQNSIEAEIFHLGNPEIRDCCDAHPSGRLLSLLDRAFYAGSYAFAYKPGAAVASARRSGTTASFDVLNKYFTIANMPVVSSNYWNNIHGRVAEDTVQDIEGMQTMRHLARNMVWMLKCIEAGKQQGIEHPSAEEKIYTNFIR